MSLYRRIHKMSDAVEKYDKDILAKINAILGDDKDNVVTKPSKNIILEINKVLKEYNEYDDDYDDFQKWYYVHEVEPDTYLHFDECMGNHVVDLLDDFVDDYLEDRDTKDCVKEFFNAHQMCNTLIDDHEYSIYKYDDSNWKYVKVFELTEDDISMELCRDKDGSRCIKCKTKGVFYIIREV